MCYGHLTGLGFAAGAMMVVGFFELIPEAIEDTSKTITVSETVLPSQFSILTNAGHDHNCRNDLNDSGSNGIEGAILNYPLSKSAGVGKVVTLRHGELKIRLSVAQLFSQVLTYLGAKLLGHKSQLGNRRESKIVIS